MNPLEERNRAKLIDALQAGLRPEPADQLAEGLSGMRWRVPSASDPNEAYWVEDVIGWDGSRTTRCDCPWGANEGPFGSTDKQRACKHVLIVWFLSLSAAAQVAVKQRDYGIRHALYEGWKKRETRIAENV